jgi:hypothetical protein
MTENNAWFQLDWTKYEDEYWWEWAVCHLNIIVYAATCPTQWGRELAFFIDDWYCCRRLKRTPIPSDPTSEWLERLAKKCGTKVDDPWPWEMPKELPKEPKGAKGNNHPK